MGKEEWKRDPKKKGREYRTKPIQADKTWAKEGMNSAAGWEAESVKESTSPNLPHFTSNSVVSVALLHLGLCYGPSTHTSFHLVVQHVFTTEAKE